MLIVVSGMIGAVADQGGATWAVLQFLLGFRGLGHDVYFIEPVYTRAEPSEALTGSHRECYFLDVMRQFDFDGRATLLDPESGQWAGLDPRRFRELARDADLLVNISGTLEDPELAGSIPTRLYLDLDPGYVQVWHSQGIDMRFGEHTHFATVGLNVGNHDCPIPDCGKRWIKTLQPVYLPEWEVSNHTRTDALTTVANWRGYGSVEHEGLVLGQKAHSMRRLFGLPRRTGIRFQLALAIHPDETADLKSLRSNGWQIVDPASVTATPSSYREFVRGSLAEFGVAKSGYVESRSGWFSDRSACYLASGRPVIAQDTGIGAALPREDGLLFFSTEHDAAQAVEALSADYERHAAAARRIAEDYLDSRRVLSKLIDAVA